MISDAWDYLTDGTNWSGQNGIGAFTTQQILLTVTALAIAVVVGLPFALWLGHIAARAASSPSTSPTSGRAIPVFAVLLVLALGPIGSKEFGPYGRAGLATLIALVLVRAAAHHHQRVCRHARGRPRH